MNAKRTIFQSLKGKMLLGLMTPFILMTLILALGGNVFLNQLSYDIADKASLYEASKASVEIEAIFDAETSPIKEMADSLRLLEEVEEIEQMRLIETLVKEMLKESEHLHSIWIEIPSSSEHNVSISKEWLVETGQSQKNSVEKNVLGEFIKKGEHALEPYYGRWDPSYNYWLYYL